jgi:hypothetical protein
VTVSQYYLCSDMNSRRAFDTYFWPSQCLALREHLQSCKMCQMLGPLRPAKGIVPVMALSLYRRAHDGLKLPVSDRSVKKTWPQEKDLDRCRLCVEGRVCRGRRVLRRQTAFVDVKGRIAAQQAQITGRCNTQPKNINELVSTMFRSKTSLPLKYSQTARSGRQPRKLVSTTQHSLRVDISPIQHDETGVFDSENTVIGQDDG